MKTLQLVHDAASFNKEGEKTLNIFQVKPMDPNYELIVANVREAFQSGRTRSVKFRLRQLHALQRMYDENTPALLEALHKDLRKPKFEAQAFEIILLKNDVRTAIKNVKKWSKATNVPRNLLALTDKLYITHEPFGVVLVIGAWNYPLHLSLMPLCGAICAGNAVILKPSELSVHCSQLLADLLPRYLDNECFKVVLGDAETSQGLLQQKFNYIFFTGSTSVGRIVHSAATKHLTPVTLELGGKCPVYIDNTANYRLTAERVMWAKLVCLGQTCISPDYVICTKEVEDKFVEQCKKVVHVYFGQNPQECKDLARIINTRHVNRLRKLLAETNGKIAMGGSVDEYDLWIEPTIIVNVNPEDSIMQEEIFGPLLPILRIASDDEAIKFINERPNPLALYIYSKNQKSVNKFLESTQAGAVSINDCMYHASIKELPFGGVGESGMGQYHGKYNFETFSRPRAVLHRSFNYFDNNNDVIARYPPYTQLKTLLVTIGLKYHSLFYINIFKYFPYLFCVLLGIFIMFLVDYLQKVVTKD